MNQNIYAVKDIVANEFQPPFYLKNDALAIKEFGKACENPDTDWNKYPSDYSLYNLGVFDTETGHIISTDNKQISNASQFTKETTHAKQSTKVSN